MKVIEIEWKWTLVFVLYQKGAVKSSVTNITSDHSQEKWVTTQLELGKRSEHTRKKPVKVLIL